MKSNLEIKLSWFFETENKKFITILLVQQSYSTFCNQLIVGVEMVRDEEKLRFH